MARYYVMTRATVIRCQWVEASNEKEAEEKSIEAPIEHEEDESEETMSIVEASGP
ncbi:hypothetical protein [Nitrobacter sp. TKz-YC02]|uniref:hypothetical protein n=1 Tax=Nitrobacter sp. TKz-YC02 TaxID=3398704 RepID=UPI003CEA4978